MPIRTGFFRRTSDGCRPLATLCSSTVPNFGGTTGPKNRGCCSWPIVWCQQRWRAPLLLARSDREAPDRLLARLPRPEWAPVVAPLGLRTRRQLAGYGLLLTSMRK